jgi:hypothetical protein
MTAALSWGVDKARSIAAESAGSSKNPLIHDSAPRSWPRRGV